MATNRLSAAACKNATTNGAAIRKLHDGDGLYLWVYHDGRKYWRLRYWQAGKEKSLSVGVYPTVTLSEARIKRDVLRKQLNADLDPSAERKATNLRKKLAAENSFGCFCRRSKSERDEGRNGRQVSDGSAWEHLDRVTG